MENIFKKYVYGETLEEYLQEVGRTEFDYYQAFLEAMDYMANKIIEAQFLNTECDDYTQELYARQIARDKINEYLDKE